MEDKKGITRQILEGERALFNSDHLFIQDTIFQNGESPLKQSSNITLQNSMFKWKYPLWYANHIHVKQCTWFEMARSGVWYTNDITIEDSAIEAPKNFRRCSNITLKNVSFPNAQETLWNCNNIQMRDVIVKGDYFGMNSNNIVISNLTLYGNYSFDGGKNIEIHDSRLLSKDAFWNSENVTIYDSFISGEYLGWNAKNLTLINCTVESLQGLCYIDKLVMKDCKTLNTTLAFEYSTVDVEMNSSIDSILNPISGSIQAQSIGEIILEKDKINPNETHVHLQNSIREYA